MRNKNATKYSSHFQNKRRVEKQVLLHHSGLSHFVKAVEWTSFLQWCIVEFWCPFMYFDYVHSTFNERKKREREFKFFIDALSLQHFNLEGTLIHRFQGIEENKIHHKSLLNWRWRDETEPQTLKTKLQLRIRNKKWRRHKLAVGLLLPFCLRAPT